MALFVYGTLRPGGRLWPRLEGVTRDARRAELPGARLHYHPDVDPSASFSYPVVVLDPGAPAVVGHLLDVDDDQPDVRATVEMELAAGYDVAELEVMAGGVPVAATVFVWSGPVGPRIGSGDWFDR